MNILDSLTGARADGPPRDETFADLGLPPTICKAIAAAGISEPFPIQAAVIPDVLAGLDVCGRAPTGSGKTLAFGLPLVARLVDARRRAPVALILAPTRELAEQISRALSPYAAALGHKVATVYGGVGYGAQRKLLDQGAELVVACPGRLEDLMKMGALRLDQVTAVVIDEADQMADMGFLPAVRRIVGATAAQRQVLLFSATLEGPVAKLVDDFQDDPVPARGRREGSGHHRRPAHVLVGRAHRPSAPRGRRRRRPRVDARVLPHPPRRRPPRQATRQVRHQGRSDPRRSQPGAARSGPRGVQARQDRGAHRHRRRGSRRPRRRHRVRVALRSAGRRRHLSPPFGSHRPRRRHRRRDLARRRVDAQGDPSAPAADRRRRGDRAGRPPPSERSRSPRADAASASRRSRRRARSTRPRSPRTATIGTVKFFSPARGYGFIARPDAADLFVHHTNIKTVKGTKATATLIEGQRVRYTIGAGRRGPEAIAVTLA